MEHHDFEYENYVKSSLMTPEGLNFRCPPVVSPVASHAGRASIFLIPMDSAFKRRTTDMDTPKLTESRMTWSWQDVKMLGSVNDLNICGIRCRLCIDLQSYRERERER